MARRIEDRLRDATRNANRAIAERDRLMLEMWNRGYTLRDIARFAEISHQAVHAAVRDRIPYQGTAIRARSGR